ncbi:hypothetical protein CCACVL1_17267 [Corchorus capsularis]|uniref:Uncharacterized protein n=1 Tax=Corchorus capsularis TaxID=210143 RepID=A0A1R3HSS1_COCAP|nr:hypothetical protein CCACVL1_17267 [Corchorus capsularis]
MGAAAAACGSGGGRVWQLTVVGAGLGGSG